MSQENNNPLVAQTFFTDVFKIKPEYLETYGALNISLCSDLPLYIDPFLLFNSSSPEYQSLHSQIVQYMEFLRSKSYQVSETDTGAINLWFTFPEIKQTWLGVSIFGNRGRGLGTDFARKLHRNLRVIYPPSQQVVSATSHFEKIALFEKGVGHDQISDFTTNLIIEFLAEYTQKFARQYLSSHQRDVFAVRRASFNYQTESWETKNFELPVFMDDFVLLTPKNILTRDACWINRKDMVSRMRAIPGIISNDQLRARVNNYLDSRLKGKKRVTALDKEKAILGLLKEFPEFADYYIKDRESNGYVARYVSQDQVDETVSLYNVGSVDFAELLKSMPDNLTSLTSKTQIQKWLELVKDVVENKKGFELLKVNDKPIQKEPQLRLFFRLVWHTLYPEKSSENNKLAEFKRASNPQLPRYLVKWATKEDRPNLAIFYTKRLEFQGVKNILNEIGVKKTPEITFIDMRSPEEREIINTKSPDNPIRVLFLAANPVDSTRLRLDVEIREIDQALQKSKYRDYFELNHHHAVRVTDLQEYLLRHEPDIIHFSGHGAESSELVFENVSGLSQVVPVRALKNLFRTLKGSIRCVVLNACYSKYQAEAIANHIDCVIGMSNSIGDESAISFSTAFYRALAFGKNMKEAFDLGCIEIDMESLDEQETPNIFLKIPEQNTLLIANEEDEKW